MAQVPYRSASDLSEADRGLLARPINLFRALANSPGALRQHHRLGEWVRYECELDPRLRELAILQVGYTAQSAYEFSHHLVISRDFGVTDEDVAGLVAENRGEPSSLGEVERLVLRAAREMTEGRRMADDTWAALEKHLPTPRLVDLVFVISFYAMVVRILGTLDIDNEPEYQAHLAGFDFGQEGRG